MRALLLSTLLLLAPSALPSPQVAPPLESPAAQPAPAQPAAPEAEPAPEPMPESLQRALDAAVRAELTHGTSVGLSVGVVLGSQRWAGGYGLRDVASKLPVTPRTTFRVASITKSFTAVAAMQLVEQGRMDLDADVRTYVASWPEKQWVVTPRLLMSHLSGVPTYGGPQEADNVRPLSTLEALAIFAPKPLAFEPGTRFLYTTYGFNLLGAAVESVAGKPYGDYLRDHVFSPAGMQHAALDDHRTRDEHHATGYRMLDGKLQPSQFLDVSSRFGGGGTRASMEDLLGFTQSVLEHRLVSAESMRLMQTTQILKDGKLTDYGLGFATYPLRGHYVVAHAGSQPETTALIVILPAERAAIALATNMEEESARLRRLSTRLMEVLLHEGQMRRGAHLKDPVDAAVFEGLARMSSYGLAYYRWATLGPGRLPEEKDLPGAFARTLELFDRDTIAQDPKAALERMRSAHEPRSESLFIRVGTHMARTVEQAFGPERLRATIPQGPLAFFNEYLAACEAVQCPPEQRLSEELRADVARLSGRWKKAQVPALQRTRLDELERPERVWGALRRATVDRDVHPDYVDEMVRVATRYEQGGKAELQRRWLERAVELHPSSVEARLALAEAAFAAGRDKEGLKLLREASELFEGDKDTAPAALIKRSQRNTSHRSAAGLLRAGLVLHPQAEELRTELEKRERAMRQGLAPRRARARR